MAGESSKVELVFTSEDKAIVATLQKMDRALDATVVRLNKVEQASAKASTASTAGFERSAQTLTKFATGIGMITTATGLVMSMANQLRREYDNLISRQKNAANAQLSIAEAQAEAFKGLGDNSISKEQLAKRVQEISLKTPADQSGLYSAIGQSLGAKPAGVSDADVVEAAGVAARLNPYNSQAMGTNLLSLMFQKSKTPKASFADIAGFQMQVKRLSPTMSEEAFAQNIVPGIGESMAFGSSAPEAAALLSYMGNEMGDVEGRQTRTAVLSFQKQLMEALPNEKGGLLNRLKALQKPENARLRKHFLGPLAGARAKGSTPIAAFGIEGEAKAFVPMLNLIEGKTIGNLEQMLAQVPEIAGSGTTFEQTMSDIERQPIQMTAKAQRTFATATQAQQLNNQAGAKTAVFRQGLDELNAAMGKSWTERTAAATMFDVQTLLGADPAALAKRQFDLAGSDRPVMTGYGGGSTPVVQATMDEKTQQAMQKMAMLLEQFVNKQEKPLKVEGPMQFRPPASAAQNR